MERSFPWEDDGDPPDQALGMQVCKALRGRWRGGDVQCACSSLCRLPMFAGPACCETVVTHDMGGDSAQLDLGLTDITKFFSYSKLWRMLYFVNDEPFRIRNHGRGTYWRRLTNKSAMDCST